MVRVNVILDHIRECCEDIFDFVRDMELEDFLSNKLVRNAVGMSLINIGELVKALPIEYRNDHPEIPWKRIAGMRDLAAHKYQTLDMVAVWNVVQDRIPETFRTLRTNLQFMNSQKDKLYFMQDADDESTSFCI